ncbi:MAG: hypothetical protein Q8L06_14920, partial [Pseudohongiella sp.]|nr:hypothetical protein [Pseudohongiella sp.]
MKKKLAFTLGAMLLTGQTMAVEFPAAVSQKFTDLSAAQRSFLASDEPLRIMNVRQLTEAFESRTPAQIATYVSDL